MPTTMREERDGAAGVGQVKSAVVERMLRHPQVACDASPPGTASRSSTVTPPPRL